jgi:hypothetical protein
LAVQTFNKLMQIEHEHDNQREVLDVVSISELVCDGGGESKENGGVKFVLRPFLVAGRSLTLIRSVVVRGRECMWCALWSCST